VAETGDRKWLGDPLRQAEDDRLEVGDRVVHVGDSLGIAPCEGRMQPHVLRRGFVPTLLAAGASGGFSGGAGRRDTPLERLLRVGGLHNPFT
jgi:hypothetical protein